MNLALLALLLLGSIAALSKPAESTHLDENMLRRILQAVRAVELDRRSEEDDDDDGDTTTTTVFYDTTTQIVETSEEPSDDDPLATCVLSNVIDQYGQNVTKGELLLILAETTCFISDLMPDDSLPPSDGTHSHGSSGPQSVRRTRGRIAGEVLEQKGSQASMMLKRFCDSLATDMSASFGLLLRSLEMFQGAENGKK